MKKITFYLLLSFVIFPKFSNANLRAIISGAVRSESKVVSAASKKSSTLLRNSDEFFLGAFVLAAKDLQVSKSLKKGMQSNLKRFIKKRGSDLLDFGTDIAENSINPELDFGFKKSPSTYFKEIIKSPLYFEVYKSMCNRFKVDTLTPTAQYLALNGALVNGLRIANEKLYFVYLICSKTFARDELLQLRKSVGCDKKKYDEINQFAARLKVELPKSNCAAKEDEGDWVDGLFGLIATGLLFFIIYKFYQWIRSLFVKIISLFKYK